MNSEPSMTAPSWFQLVSCNDKQIILAFPETNSVDPNSRETGEPHQVTLRIIREQSSENKDRLFWRLFDHIRSLAKCVTWDGAFAPNMDIRGRQAVFATRHDRREGTQGETDLLRTTAARATKVTHKHLLGYYALGCDDPMLTVSGEDGVGRWHALMEPWATAGAMETSLHDLSRNKKLDADEIIGFTLQLLDAMKYLHNEGWTINVLRSESIMVNLEQGCVKVVDWLNFSSYHSASSTDENGPTVQRVYEFRHPDLLPGFVDHLLCSSKELPICRFWHDTWSLGCVIVDVLTQGHMQTEIKDGSHPVIPNGTPDFIRDLCKRCFDRETTARALYDLIVQEISCFTHSIVIGSAAQDFFFHWHPSSVIFLGQGSFGCVYSATLKWSTGTEWSKRSNICALKIFNSPLDVRDIPEKWCTLLGLNHPNIVKYVALGQINVDPYGIRGRTNQDALIMEYCAGGSLRDYCKEKLLDAKTISEYFTQIVSAVRFLHQRPRPIFHGDINGVNIFLTVDKKACKLGDMDSFYLMPNSRTMTGGLKIGQGKLLHMSPEMLSYSIHGVAEGDEGIETGIGRTSDIWSVGCTVLEMVGQVYQYHDINKQSLEMQIDFGVALPVCYGRLHLITTTSTLSSSITAMITSPAYVTALEDMRKKYPQLFENNAITVTTVDVGLYTESCTPGFEGPSINEFVGAYARATEARTTEQTVILNADKQNG
ncbi:putative Mitogen-activated protein kinase kinase kinase 4 [Hypsibius exemplaris]|uniref:non-specific serine/threonine protein kinase n=1 Tax=Hypsibius exemplaris TaxID=2072580 RepID=A0A1W0XBR7_HYPEX|nr:putative Mitogen-activated protein kinase kinase kinase 4 [Hypsibius exemplaris]